jgi:hypothetical protein
MEVDPIPLPAWAMRRLGSRDHPEQKQRKNDDGDR